MSLWEILVPKYMHEYIGPPSLSQGFEQGTIQVAGEPAYLIPVEYHNEWDNFVRRKAGGGQTIMRSAKGVYTSEMSGSLMMEPMIPVRILCNRKTMEEIVDFTGKFYNQEVVLAYHLSDEIILRRNFT